jgi:hypothetical protein
MCFSQPDDKESGKPKKLKKSLCAELKLQLLRTMSGVNVRTTLVSAVESNFGAQHFLISLQFISKILAHSAFSETFHESCPSRCTCESSDEFTGLSELCN